MHQNTEYEFKIFNNKSHYLFFMFAIIVIAAIGFFASDIYLPSLPTIAHYFKENTMRVQLTVSIFLLSMAIFQIFIGALSDKFGRKKILVISVLIFIVASLGCYDSHSLNALILFRFLQGIGSACGLSIGHAIIADIFGPTQSAKPLSIVIPLVAFSPAVAPILGGLIEEHSQWRNIFLFLAGYGILILLFLITPIIPKIPRRENLSTRNGINILKILKDKQFIGYALFMMNSNACYFAFLAASPFLLKEYGYSPTQIGYAFCAASFPYMSSSFLGRKLSMRFTYIHLIFIGLLCDAVGVICMLCFSALNWPSMMSIMIPVFIISIGNGFLMPFSSASAIALYPRNAGLITGTLATAQLCAASLATFLMGVFANGKLYPLGLFNLCVVTLTFSYFIVIFGSKLRK